MAYTDTGSRYGYATPGPIEKALLDAVDKQHDARCDRIAEAWTWYGGDHPDSLTTRAGEGNDNVKLNYSRMIVDKGVGFLAGSDIAMELEERGKPGETTDPEPFDPEAKKPPPLPAQVFVDDWQDDTNLTLWFQRFAQNGALSGTPFYRLYPAQDGQVYPRVAILDPQLVRVVTEPDDYEHVLAYKVEWPTLDLNKDGSFRCRRSVIERDGAAWKISEQEKTEKADVWTTLSEEAWDYTWPPIGHCQNLPSANDFFGLPDLTPDLLDLNRAINGDASNLRRVVRLHAHPHDVGFGFTAGEVDVTPGGMTVLPSEKSKVERLEMSSQMEGAIGVFDHLRQALHTLSRIPEVASGKLENSGSLSGVALSILYGPIVELTEAKRKTYGPMLRELALRVLELSGQTRDYRVELLWPEVIPSDPEAERRVLILDGDLGASKSTRLEKAGYDADMEMQKRAVEDAASVDAAQQAFDGGNLGDGGGGLGNQSTPPAQPGNGTGASA